MPFPCTFVHTLIFSLTHIHQCYLKLLLNLQYLFHVSICFALIPAVAYRLLHRFFRDSSISDNTSSNSFQVSMLLPMRLHILFSLREKCPNRTFFWSVFSRIRIKYVEIRSISPYSVRMRENMDQKKHGIWTLFTQCLC